MENSSQSQITATGRNEFMTVVYVWIKGEKHLKVHYTDRCVPPHTPSTGSMSRSDKNIETDGLDYFNITDSEEDTIYERAELIRTGTGPEIAARLVQLTRVPHFETYSLTDIFRPLSKKAEPLIGIIPETIQLERSSLLSSIKEEGSRSMTPEYDQEIDQLQLLATGVYNTADHDVYSSLLFEIFQLTNDNPKNIEFQQITKVDDVMKTQTAPDPEHVVSNPKHDFHNDTKLKQAKSAGEKAGRLDEIIQSDLFDNHRLIMYSESQVQWVETGSLHRELVTSKVGTTKAAPEMADRVAQLFRTPAYDSCTLLNLSVSDTALGEIKMPTTLESKHETGMRHFDFTNDEKLKQIKSAGEIAGRLTEIIDSDYFEVHRLIEGSESMVGRVTSGSSQVDGKHSIKAAPEMASHMTELYGIDRSDSCSILSLPCTDVGGGINAETPSAKKVVDMEIIPTVCSVVQSEIFWEKEGELITSIFQEDGGNLINDENIFSDSSTNKRNSFMVNQGEHQTRKPKIVYGAATSNSAEVASSITADENILSTEDIRLVTDIGDWLECLQIILQNVDKKVLDVKSGEASEESTLVPDETHTISSIAAKLCTENSISIMDDEPSLLSIEEDGMQMINPISSDVMRNPPTDAHEIIVCRLAAQSVILEHRYTVEFPIQLIHDPKQRASYRTLHIFQGDNFLIPSSEGNYQTVVKLTPHRFLKRQSRFDKHFPRTSNLNSSNWQNRSRSYEDPNTEFLIDYIQPTHVENVGKTATSGMALMSGRKAPSPYPFSPISMDNLNHGELAIDPNDPSYVNIDEIKDSTLTHESAPVRFDQRPENLEYVYRTGLKYMKIYKASAKRSVSSDSKFLNRPGSVIQMDQNDNSPTYGTLMSYLKSDSDLHANSSRPFFPHGYVRPFR